MINHPSYLFKRLLDFDKRIDKSLPIERFLRAYRINHSLAFMGLRNNIDAPLIEGIRKSKSLDQILKHLEDATKKVSEVPDGISLYRAKETREIQRFVVFLQDPDNIELSAKEARKRFDNYNVPRRFLNFFIGTASRTASSSEMTAVMLVKWYAILFVIDRSLRFALLDETELTTLDEVIDDSRNGKENSLLLSLT